MSNRVSRGVPGRARRAAVALVALVTSLTGLVAVETVVAPPAEATHFRASQLTWHRHNPATRAVEFHFSSAFRRSYFSQQYGITANVGTIVPIEAVQSGYGLSFGDGQLLPSFNATVVTVDAPNDTVIVQATLPHTYGGSGVQFTAAYTNCCRLSAPTHQNNPDRVNRIESLVSLVNGVTGSPGSAISPIVDCPVNADCRFFIPGVDADGSILTYRLATVTEASADPNLNGNGGFVQPRTGNPQWNQSQSPGANLATVEPATGLYRWVTTGAVLDSGSTPSYFSTQVIVEKRLTAGAAPVSKVAVDFFIRLNPATAPNQPPSFIAPTPADGTVLVAGTNELVELNVSAVDPQPADTVSLTTLGLPNGATFTTTPGNTATGTFSWTPTAFGTTILTLNAADQLGLQAVQRSITIRVSDRQAPTLTAPSAIVVEATGPAGATVDFAVAAVDDVDGPITPSCSRTSGSPFSLGTTTVTCTATDAAGNEATASFPITVHDTTGPTITVTDLVVEATGPDGATILFTPVAADLVDGPVPVTCTPPSGSTFAIGSTSVTCTATDAAGNPAANGFAIVVQDTTAPVLVLPATTIEATGPAGADVTLTPTAADQVDGAIPARCTPNLPGTFRLGSHPVSCSAADAAGNETTATTTINVVDTTPPAVSVPTAIAVEATEAGGALVSYTATAEDIVDGAMAPACSTPPGSLFPLGATTVTCTATDASGNTGSASFLVTVSDTTPPVLTVPPAQTLEATGPAGEVATFGVSAADAVDGMMTPACDQTSGATFALGTTTVTCSATDATGNTASASFEITVKDTMGPVITVPGTITVEATGPGGETVPFAVTAADVVDGSVVADCSPLSGSSFRLGATVVGCTATDSRGNEAVPTTFVVHVVDTVAPVVTYSGVQATYQVDGQVAITCTATDSGSGIASTTCADIIGPASSFLPGNNLYSASATDRAGNVGAGRVSFNVDITADNLCRLTMQYVTEPAIAKELCTKLAHAREQAARGNAGSSHEYLKSYRNQVAAQSGKSMTAAQAATLDRLAVALEATFH